MTSNIFDTAKHLVSARSAAEYYGFQPNKANFIQCPFHDENTPSLKLYGTNWHCFGCGKGGTSIDFVMELFGLSPLEAVRKMNSDFSLLLPLDEPPSEEQQTATRQRQKLQLISDKYEQWRDNLTNQLNVAYRVGHQVLLNWPDKLTEKEILAVKWHSSLEYWSDLLLSGNLDKQMEVFRYKKEVEELCNRILKSTQTKSNEA